MLKLSKGLSFDQIAKAINKDEVWLAAAFYGQVRQWKQFRLTITYSIYVQAKFTEDELKEVATLLDLSEAAVLSELGSHWFPNRGLGPVPPRDPVLYRLFEVRLFVSYCILLRRDKYDLGLPCIWTCYQGMACLISLPVTRNKVSSYWKAIIHEKVREHLDQRQAPLRIFRI